MGIEKKFFFQVKSDLLFLEEVLERFGQIKGSCFSKKEWLECQLALAEGFTNAVRHAHKNLPPDTPIQIEISLSKDNITLKIWDYGEPFDLEKFIANSGDRQLDCRQDDLSYGGRGIAILQKIADRLSYEPMEDGRNCLTIRKQLNQIERQETI